MSMLDRTVFAGAGTQTVAWQLVVMRDERTINRLQLGHIPVIIGRDRVCGLWLDHPSVSRNHARLEPDGDGRWKLTDLRSHNGTFINAKPATSAVLSDGDWATIGPFTLLLRPVKSVVDVAEDVSVVQTLRELDAPRLELDQLNQLSDFGRAILDMPDPLARIDALCQLMLNRQLGGRWAVVVAVDSAGTAAAVRSPQVQPGQNPILSRSLLKAVLARNEAAMASNAQTGNLPPADIQMSISPEISTFAAIAAPLSTAADDAMIILCVGFPPQYGTAEWLALVQLAVRQYQQAETVWGNVAARQKLAVLEADLERARRVQDRLVPRRCEVPGLDIAVRFRPCYGVGGDYVDALVLPDGRALLVIADVSGKGLAAAMVAMGLHTVVHGSVRQWTSLSDLGSALDIHLVETLSDESFVTLLAVTLDPKTGRTEILNAGHPPAVVFNSAGKCRELGLAGNMMLGPFRQELLVETGTMNLDETMLILTDGCLEVFDGSGAMLGTDQFCQHTAAAISTASTTSTAADAVVQFLDHWQGDGKPTDDRTLLVVRRSRQAV